MRDGTASRIPAVWIGGTTGLSLARQMVQNFNAVRDKNEPRFS